MSGIPNRRKGGIVTWTVAVAVVAIVVPVIFSLFQSGIQGLMGGQAGVEYRHEIEQMYADIEHTCQTGESQSGLEIGLRESVSASLEVSGQEDRKLSYRDVEVGSSSLECSIRMDCNIAGHRSYNLRRTAGGDRVIVSCEE